MRHEPLLSHVSRKLVVLLLAVTVPPAATLVWLGLQLLAQDRALLAQREAERHQAEAQAVARSLESALAGAERLLAGGLVPAGMARVAMTPDRVTVSPAGAVLWLPVSRVDRAATEASFDEAETVEYDGAADRARALYEQLAHSTNRATRAGALVRLARVHRQAQRWDATIAVYRRLAALGDTAVIDAPADLQARRSICAVLEAAGRSPALAREATSLRADFIAGRWGLDRPVWELTSRDIEHWTGEPVPRSVEHERLSTLVGLLWDQPRSSADQPVSRRTFVVNRAPMTVAGRTDGDARTFLAISSSVVDTWMRDASARALGLGRLTLLDDSGHALMGSPEPSASAGIRLARGETGLPWTIALSPSDRTPEAAALDGRRRLLSLGLVAILVLLAGGSYFLWRVMQRELAVGRLQTEFVAAVSHEFRTPLTSLRHVTDLLEESDDVPVERRAAMYGALGRNVDRLHRLVESLLDFSRMEGGRRPYDLQPIDAGQLVTGVVAEFRTDGAPGGVAVELELEASGPLMFRADAPSLTNALWNLLDNAVKYSPGRERVHVSVRRHPVGIAIAVRDEGLGIPVREQKEIFRRFVRGEHARRLGIKGTGLGLAMVAHIAKAHRGLVEMESEEGVGSTFRLVLPALA